MSINDGARVRGVAAMVLCGAFALLVSVLAAPRAFAQAPGGSLATSYAGSADKPIDIEADALEVDDKKKLAVFKGNVSATQGEFNLRAREIQVTYTASKSGQPASQPVKEAANGAANSALPGGGGDITQIDAKGKVLVTTKDNQTATSDWAIFEVKKQLVTIGGDVVLSRGADTIKGSRLVIDLKSGISRFETGGGGESGQPSERLKAIFTPKSHAVAPK